MQRSAFYAISFAALVMSACGHDAFMPTSGGPEILAVEPVPASAQVSTLTPIRLTFSRPMMIGTAMLVVLHVDTVTGTEVAGTATWSLDRTVLTFTPAAALNSNTMYVVHLGGEMRGMDGARLDHGGCENRGGRTVSGGMMGESANMMGSGWRSADGTYGMIFSFRTV